MAGGEFAGDGFLEGAAALQEGVEVFRLEGIEFRKQSGGERGGPLERTGEGVEPLVQPAGVEFRAAAAAVGDVDVDGAGLADAVEAADPLL